MKIYDNDQIPKNLYPEARTKPQLPADKEFGAILKESVENSKPDVTGTRRTTFINPLNGVQMSASSNFDKQYAIDRTENLIGLLDQYRHKLTDPEVSLKHIHPIIREIDREKDNLAPVLDSLPEDEELKDIINQTLVTASLEVTKFYRGDYIAP